MASNIQNKYNIFLRLCNTFSKEPFLNVNVLVRLSLLWCLNFLFIVYIFNKIKKSLSIIIDVL